MNKILAIGLVFIMMISSFPLVIVKNYCPSKGNTQISFTEGGPAKCCCGKAKKAVDNCCRKNTIKLQTIKDAYTPVFKVKTPENTWNVFSALATVHLPFSISTESIAILSKAHSRCWYSPPRPPASFTVLYSTFLI